MAFNTNSGPVHQWNDNTSSRWFECTPVNPLLGNREPGWMKDVLRKLQDQGTVVVKRCYEDDEIDFFASCAFEWSLDPDGTLATLPAGQMLIRLWAGDRKPHTLPIIEKLHDVADGHNVAVTISGWSGEICPHFEVVMGGTNLHHTHVFSLRTAPWVNDGDTLHLDISEPLGVLRDIYGQRAI